MKPVSLCRVAALAAWLTLSASSSAQDPFTPGENEVPSMIRVQVEWIEVAHAQLTELLTEPRSTSDDTDLRKKVAGLIGEGKATVRETMLCTAPNGQKATTESIQEFIYPTEYGPAQLPTKDSLPNAEAIGPSPTSFETRNLGCTLEMEPMLENDGKRISLRFVPEITYHTSNRIWAEWKGVRGEAHVQMPDFYTLRINSQVKLLPGKPLLTAALSPKSETGFPDFNRKLLIFVRADVLKPGGSPPAP
jgi:hypothetical protein